MSEWRVIPRLPNYIASPDGRIKHIRKDKEVNQHTDHKGYKRIAVLKNGKRGNALVHRLILETFVGPCPEGCETSHLDGNRTNNNVENLKWESRKDNHRHKLEHGTHHRGSKCPTSKLTESDVVEIRKQLAEGRTLKTIAVQFGVIFQTISDIKRGKRWSYV